MIHLPKRSVTRFFVPLIDVLILLFCIFLLMPFVSHPDATLQKSNAQADPKPELSQDVTELQRQLAEERRRVERLLRERSHLANQINVKVLEIDSANGQLYSFDATSPEPRQEVRDQSDAQRLIDRHKRTAGAREVFFLILYPRELTGYPLQRQIDKYRRWFKDVPHGFDNPRS
ncbi:MAG: hypothetical protein LC104_12340 [Bacteroidales bacterium]|nr:hypothetical protein [Bacteroidales bacterium]